MLGGPVDGLFSGRAGRHGGVELECLAGNHPDAGERNGVSGIITQTMNVCVNTHTHTYTHTYVNCHR